MIARLLVTSLFLVLGSLAFLGQQGLAALRPATASAAVRAAGSGPGAHGSRVARVASEALLLREAEQRGLHMHDPLVRDRLVRNMRFADPTSQASDSALFATALEIGMHRSDPIVRARLCERAADQLLAEAPPASPTRAELERYLERHVERFRRPGVVAFRQVLLKGSELGSARERAAALLGTLRGRGADAAQGLGDATLLPARLQASPEQVARRFGEDFAEQLTVLEPGRWHGPVDTRFGAHLVWIEKRTLGGLPALSEVAPAVRTELQHDARRAQRRAILEELRNRYASAAEEAP